MDNILRELYYLMDEHTGETETPACRSAFRALNAELDKADDELHKSIYDAMIRYLSEERFIAFRLGLRLGLQLHTF